MTGTLGAMPDDPHAALARLEPLVGEWTLESPIAPGQAGRSVFEWALGGAFLLERSEAPDPAPNGLTIVAADEDGAGYTQHYFDYRGVVRVYAMTFDDGVWTLLRTSADFTPLSFSQRYTGRFSDDGSAIEGAWERTEEDGTWVHDFDITYRRKS